MINSGSRIPKDQLGISSRAAAAAAGTPSVLVYAINILSDGYEATSVKVSQCLGDAW